MASGNNYLQFILGQLSDLDDITYRAMMGGVYYLLSRKNRGRHL